MIGLELVDGLERPNQIKIRRIKTVKERSHEFYHGTAEEKDYSYAIPKDLRDATN